MGSELDGTNTPNRTLICYKETHYDLARGPARSAHLDRSVGRPAVQPAWGRGPPANALTGQGSW